MRIVANFCLIVPDEALWAEHMVGYTITADYVSIRSFSWILVIPIGFATAET